MRNVISVKFAVGIAVMFVLICGLYFGGTLLADPGDGPIDPNAVYLADPGDGPIDPA